MTVHGLSFTTSEPGEQGRINVGSQLAVSGVWRHGSYI